MPGFPRIAAATLVGLFLLVPLSLGQGCHRPEGKPAPATRSNVLLVTIDTLRADAVPPYGAAAKLPSFERLVKHCATFRNGYSATSTTGPSHSSLFSSRYIEEHGVTMNGVVLPDEEVVLAERLHRAGYSTKAVVSSFAVFSRFGYGQGFDDFDESFEGPPSVESIGHWEGQKVDAQFDQRAEFTTQAALEALRGDSRKPKFVWVHYFDPHSPYDPPADFAPKNGSRNRKILYAAEVAYLDFHLEALLDEVLDDPRWLTIVTSDHGEGLGDHGIGEHGAHLFEPLTRIPFYFCQPGAISPRILESGIATHIDVPTTITGILGLDPVEGWRGFDLSAQLLGRPGAPEQEEALLQRRYYYGSDGVIAGSRLSERLVSLRSGDWKYYQSLDSEYRRLFDLRSDAAEQEDLAAKQTKVVQGLEDSVARLRSGVDDLEPDTPTIDPETKASLRALGYVE